MGEVRCVSFAAVLFLSTYLFCFSSAFPDEGKWDFEFDKNNRGVTIRKSLFKESKIVVQVSCQPIVGKESNKISISWAVSSVACWDNGTPESLRFIDEVVRNSTLDGKSMECDCTDHSTTCDLTFSDFLSEDDNSGMSSNDKNKYKGPFPVAPDDRKKRSEDNEQSKERRETQGKGQTSQQYLQKIHTKMKAHPVFVTPEDGFYTLILKINGDTPDAPFEASVHVEMFGKHGYLAASDWPLLPFYGAMCLVYLVMGLAWLIVSFLQWRDLLRIQFWIGGVILLGMLEKAMFYAEYQSINTTGQPVIGAILVAELVSCGKRTLARMLVIIVSLGFGIVKPRLGAMLHRVVGTGILYFVLASYVAYIQITRPKNDPANPLLIANIPVAVLDSAICWWIFTSLVQTTRTLRLRRNLVKLNLYRHFTTTLIFAVFSSIIFMLYSMKFHHIALCATNWSELWVDEAYWRLLFSVILLVIMILWRPTNNNQRYAFTPLLDAPEDDDDEEEEQFVNNAYGVKMRAPTSGNSSPKQKLSTNSAEEDLKWVEENIPSSLADTALPILDSDEEIMNTRFEISKMQ